MATRELQSLTQFLIEEKVLHKTPVVRCDDQAAIQIMSTSKEGDMVKEFKLRTLRLRQYFRTGEYLFKHDNIADIFTKNLPISSF